LNQKSREVTLTLLTVEKVIAKVRKSLLIYNGNCENGRLFYVLTCAGALLLISIIVWPLLRTPLLMDEVYGVIGIMGITPNSSLLDVLINPFRSDVYNFYLYDSGRVTPVGVIMYQGGYWVVSNLALVTGVHIATIYALSKLSLLMLTALSLRLLMRQFLSGEKCGQLATYLTLFTFVIFIVGLRTDMATRNGLTVYPFLTYTAALLAFLVPALLLIGLRKFYRRVTFYAAAAVVAILLGFSYELHYIALFMAFMILLFAPVEKSRASVARRGAIIIAIVFIGIQIYVRYLISKGCKESLCYTGTSIDINEKLPVHFLNNLRGNLPARGKQIFEQAKKEEFIIDVSLTQYLLTAVLLLALFTIIYFLRPFSNESIFEESDARAIKKLAHIFFFVAGVSILLTSLSVAAQEVLINAVPYRGYVLIWILISAGVTLTIYSILQKHERHHTIQIAIAASVILFGVYSLPFQQRGTDMISSSRNNKVFYDLHKQFFDPAKNVSSVENCKLTEDIGDSRRAQALRKNLNNVFEDLTGKKFCYPLPQVDEINMPFIDR
jgi:hypothetical protein